MNSSPSGLQVANPNPLSFWSLSLTLAMRVRGELTTEARVPPDERAPDVRDQTAVKFPERSVTVLVMVSLVDGFTCPSYPSDVTLYILTVGRVLSTPAPT